MLQYQLKVETLHSITVPESVMIYKYDQYIHTTH